jgi:predicted nucleic acid-binding protein
MVVDASSAIALFIPDEDAPSALTGDRLVGSIAPTLWPYEVLSALRSAERIGRIAHDDAVQAATALASLPIEFVHPSFHDVLALSRRTDLSIYDASYLALALTSRLPLATRDRRLASAAADVGIATV